MYFIGCSGWFYWHWRDKFYPQNLKQNEWFKYYTKYFSTVELNSPFYHWPKESTVRSWYKAAPEGFIYTLKVNNIITHIKRFNETEELIKEFYKLGDELKDKLGCFLFQLPPSLKFSMDRLKVILEQLDHEMKNVIEFRNASWFNEDVYNEFKKNGVIFCIISYPNLPEDFIKTGDDIYIRFHGKKTRYASNYTNKELDVWAKRIKGSNAKNVWAYFNNDFNAYAITNSLYLKRLLS